MGLLHNRALKAPAIALLLMLCAPPPKPDWNWTGFGITIVQPNHPDSIYYTGDTLRLEIEIQSDSARTIRIQCDSIADTSISVEGGVDSFCVTSVLSGTGARTIDVLSILLNGEARDTTLNIYVRGYSPTIPSQSDSVLLRGVGDSSTVWVHAQGTPPLRYQWFRDGSIRTNDTLATRFFLRTQYSDSGVYFCIVSNGWDPPDTSSRIRLRVLDTASCQKPTIAPIVYNPDSFVVGKPYAVSIRATGAGLGYQWYRNGALLAGMTGDTLRMTTVSSGDTGIYFCIVKTACQSADTSDTFALHVAHLPPNHAPQFTTQPFTMAVAIGANRKSDVPALAQDTIDKDTISYAIDVAASVLPTQITAVLDTAHFVVVTASSTATAGSNYRIAVVATDSRGGRDTLLVAVTVFDSTAADTVRPIFTWKSGPHLPGERVKTATGTIVYSVYDFSGLDTAYATVNGTFAGALVKLTGNDYSLSYDLGTHYHQNRIVLHAWDKAARHNEDSAVITLDYNTVPAAPNSIVPANGTSGVETSGGVAVTWSGGDDGDGDPVSYLVWYDTTRAAMKDSVVVSGPKSARLPNALGHRQYFLAVIAVSAIHPEDRTSSDTCVFSTLNHPPAFTQSATDLPDSSDLGSQFSFPLSSSDPDGDPCTTWLVSSTPNINALWQNGIITWGADRSALAMGDSATIRMAVRDGKDTTYMQWTMRVVPHVWKALPNLDIGDNLFAAIDSNIVFKANGINVKKSSDGGRTWTSFAAMKCPITQMKMHGNQLYLLASCDYWEVNCSSIDVNLKTVTPLYTRINQKALMMDIAPSGKPIIATYSVDQSDPSYLVRIANGIVIDGDGIYDMQVTASGYVFASGYKVTEMGINGLFRTRLVADTTKNFWEIVDLGVDKPIIGPLETDRHSGDTVYVLKNGLQKAIDGTDSTFSVHFQRVASISALSPKDIAMVSGREGWVVSLDGKPVYTSAAFDTYLTETIPAGASFDFIIPASSGKAAFAFGGGKLYR